MKSTPKQYETHLLLSDKEYMQKMLESGKTMKQIGVEIGVSDLTVRRWMKAHGLGKPRVVVHNPELATSLSKIK